MVGVDVSDSLDRVTVILGTFQPGSRATELCINALFSGTETALPPTSADPPIRSSDPQTPSRPSGMSPALYLMLYAPDQEYRKR